MSSGFFENDGTGNLRPILSFVGVTDMWFELDGNSDIMPRLTEADPHFPDEADVRLAVNYGYAWEYTGTLSGGGGMSTTPFWAAIVPKSADDSWAVSVGDVEIDATVNVYEQGTDALLYTMSRSNGSIPLSSVDLGGRVVYIKVREGSSELSSRFPLVNGITVPALTPHGTKPTVIDGLMIEVLQPGGDEKTRLVGFRDAVQKVYLQSLQGNFTGNLNGTPL